jgi:hypothetical protein
MNQAAPHSVEAEQGVLGSMLISPRETVMKCVEKIGEEYFYVPAHRTIYNVLVDLWKNRRAIDLITVTQALRDRNLLESVGGAASVTSLFTFVPTAANVEYYLDTVCEKHARRKIITAATESIRRAREEPADVEKTLAFAQQEIQAIKCHGRNGAAKAEQSWTDALDSAVVTSSELQALELIPRKKLLGDWFCEGDCGFLFAFRGVGKTWLTLAIAQALSTGGKLGDWQAHAPVKVLYVDGEMPADLMRDRSKGLNASNANLEFLNHDILFERTGKVLNITNPEVQQALTAHCVNTDSKVLILDNLSTLASGMKENDADSWELVSNWFLELRRRKIAAIIVHHAGRSGEMRGTTKREDSVFWTIALDDRKKDAADKRGARFVSRFTKPSRNTQDEIPAYEWHFVTDDATGEVSICHKQKQTLEMFRQCIEEGVTENSQLAEELKVSPGTISKWAKKGIDDGWLRKKGRGYELIEEP